MIFVSDDSKEILSKYGTETLQKEEYVMIYLFWQFIELNDQKV